MPKLLAVVLGIVLLSASGLAESHLFDAVKGQFRITLSDSLPDRGISEQPIAGAGQINLYNLGVTLNGAGGASSNPATVALLGAGMLLVGWLGRRRAARARLGVAGAFTARSQRTGRERIETRQPATEDAGSLRLVGIRDEPDGSVAAHERPIMGHQ